MPAFALPMIRTRNWNFGTLGRDCCVAIGVEYPRSVDTFHVRLRQVNVHSQFAGITPAYFFPHAVYYWLALSRCLRYLSPPRVPPPGARPTIYYSTRHHHASRSLHSYASRSSRSLIRTPYSSADESEPARQHYRHRGLLVSSFSPNDGTAHRTHARARAEQMSQASNQKISPRTACPADL